MKRSGDPLDALLAQVPQHIAPARDLWPLIEAQIAAEVPGAHVSLPARRWFQLAAAVVLVVASSLVTFLLVQRSMQQQIVQARNE